METRVQNRNIEMVKSSVRTGSSVPGGTLSQNPAEELFNSSSYRADIAKKICVFTSSRRFMTATTRPTPPIKNDNNVAYRMMCSMCIIVTHVSRMLEDCFRLSLGQQNPSAPPTAWSFRNPN